MDLQSHGLVHPGTVHANLSPAALVELALHRREGMLAENGALVANTGSRTGRSPRDRYIVAHPGYKDQIGWGAVNQPMEPEVYQRLLEKTRTYFQGRDLFVFDGWACADPKYRLPVRVIAEKAWHALFAQCLLLRPRAVDRDGFVPELTIFAAASVHADPARDGTRTDAFIVLDLEQKQVVIGGTHYAGEIKKSVFSVLNYLMPQRGVFPMHCSANVGTAGDTALLFGLSGTGKTTLSADPQRRLIGDDEHGWSDEGIFNFEGGCYAKTIRLSRAGEPQIWNAIRFGAVLENVVLDPITRRPNYDDDHYTENTRAAYPIEHIDNADLTGRGGHPTTILFLACDAFGVLPPLSKLSHPQALYHFLSGYTAKVAGTEAGVTEPQATFSTCFAAPFLPLPPARYAQMLQARLQQHGSRVWLVNTGWTGGPHGQGTRIPLAHTRRLVSAALAGELDNAPCSADPVFGVMVPDVCPGVPPQILKPRNTWKQPEQYDLQAQHLAGLFQANFGKYAATVSEEVRKAGPRV